MNPISLQQLSETDANTSTSELQTRIEDAELDDTYIAKTFQVFNFGSIMIPFTRSAEFDAADAEKKQNFAFFSANAIKKEYAGVGFNTAWELEYNKIY